MTRWYRQAGHGWLMACALTACAQDDPARNGSTDPTDVPVIAAIPATVSMSSFLGGSDQDQVRDVTMDAQGNMYVVGGTKSPNFRTTAGAFDQSPNGNYDVFVAKFSTAGQLVFSTLLGGPGYDRAYAVELDPQGYIIIGGRSGGGLPATAGHFSPTFKGGKQVGGYGPQDGFVCKLTPDGSAVVFCGYIGTADEHIVRDVAVDGAGNIYAPYLADQSGIPASWTTGGYMGTYPGRSTNLVIKIAPDGNRVLAGTWFGGSGDEYGNPSIRWANGRLYLLSRTTSTDLPVPGGFDGTLGGAWDLYLAVFSDNLASLNFATYIGGSSTEDIETHNLAVDAAGNAYVASNTSSRDLPKTVGHYQSRLTGPSDAFVMKISPAGALIGTSYYGGSQTDQFQGIALNAQGRIFLSTITSSPAMPQTANPLGSMANGSMGLVVMSNNLDTLLFAQFIGGSGSDESRAIAVGQNGSVLLGGMTQSANWWLRSPYQGAFGGGNLDGIIVRYLGF